MDTNGWANLRAIQLVLHQRRRKRQSLLLFGWLLLATPAAVQAQFSYSVTSNQTVTITGYTGTNDVVAIPSTIDGLPVTSIESDAFYGSSITGVTIPNTVASIGTNAFVRCAPPFGTACDTFIGASAFSFCPSLSNIIMDPLNSDFSSVDGVLFSKDQTTLVQYPRGKLGDYIVPNTVSRIGDYAFCGCSGLTNVTIPNSVTSIGYGTFFRCSSLISVTVGSGLTSIGYRAFAWCFSLTSVYFQGNAPTFVGADVFSSEGSTQPEGSVTIYYLPGTMRWPFGWPWSSGIIAQAIPSAVWTLPYPVILTSNPRFGVQSNQFGFTVSWATNASVIVEACTDLANPVWTPLATNALSGGTLYFSDPQWTNYSAHFYRIRSQ